MNENDTSSENPEQQPSAPTGEKLLADKKPLAGEKPLADKKPSVNKESSAEQENKPSSHPGKSGFLNNITIYFLLLLLAGLCLFFGYYFWQQNQKHQTEYQLTQDQLSQTQASLAQLQTSLENSSLLTNKREATTSNRLLVAEQRIEAQHKRLQGLSSTSREDWLLAEAEYLLRLANQRVLIEHSPASADGLLAQADEILKNLDDPDLFSLRQAIAKDLASLRLIEEVDHEGLYFSIKALTEQVEQLSLHPTRQEIMLREDEGSQEDKSEEQTAESQVSEASRSESSISEDSGPAQTDSATESVWQKMRKGLSSTFSFLSQYIKVRDHSEAPPALLAPDSAIYLQQNLRLKLERAQLALLREDQKIYVSSLGEAIDWLQRYYPPSQSTHAFTKQLKVLQQTDIVQVLPDITYSLELLHDYIKNLHKLKGVDLQNTNEQTPGEAL